MQFEPIKTIKFVTFDKHVIEIRIENTINQLQISVIQDNQFLSRNIVTLHTNGNGLLQKIVDEFTYIPKEE